MKISRFSYNNLIGKEIDQNKDSSKEQPKVNGQKNFLALAIEILEKFGSGNEQNFYGKSNQRTQ